MSDVYTTKNGQFVDPSGNRFIIAGLNNDNSASAATILALFPHANFFRLPMGSYDTPAQWEPLITDLMAAGKICLVEHHPWPLVNALTGAALVTESAWYKVWGAYGVGKPRLWLASLNEPQGGDLSAQHAATEAAIRSTGNLNPIGFICGIGGGNPGGVGVPTLTPATYRNMRNTFWELHVYGWIVNSSDQATVNAAVLGSVASSSGLLAALAINNADGPMPIYIGEVGPSTASVVQDFNAAAIEYTVCTWAWTQGHSQGFAGWHWDADSANAVQKNGVRTVWGEVANAAHAAVATYLKGITIVSTPSLNYTVIKPGVGAITDAANNVWTITTTGQVAVGGVPDAGTANVAEMAYALGVIWQLNTAGLWWGKSSPSAAWNPPAGTALSPLPATPTVTHATLQAALDQASALLATVRTGLSGMTP